MAYMFQTDSLLNAELQGEGTVESMRIIDIIARMGPFGWVVMALLFALLLMAIYILLERYFTIKKAAKVDKNFMNKIRDHVSAGKLEAAKAICMQTNSPVARMIYKGVLRIGRPLKDINAAIENVGNLEVSKLEKNLPVLATIAGAAPMLGFLGTVTGMINAFYKLSVGGNNIETSELAGGIYEALFTTAFGLAVGILAYIGYNWLVSLMQKVVFKMEANSVDFIDLLQEPGK